MLKVALTYKAQREKMQKERWINFGFWFFKVFERSGGTKCKLIRHFVSFLGYLVLPTYFVEIQCL
jgi:hypothetical protein